MPRFKMIPKIFTEASLIENYHDRIQYIRANRNELMRYIVQGAYHPGVIWEIPAGIPPYRAATTRDTDYILYKELGRLYLFCRGGHPTLKQYQREKLFVDLLETLHPDDAVLLCHIKEKRIPYPHLSYEFFRDAFPEWLPENPEPDWLPENPEEVVSKKDIEKEPNIPEDQGISPMAAPTEELVQALKSSKKVMSEEQKAAISAKNKAAWAARKAKSENA